MAPAANTARQRRNTAAASSDSDAEYQAYNGRLKEASAARTRLRKAKLNRDKHRDALKTAYEAALKQTESRIQNSVAKHNDPRTAIHISHLNRLKEALNRRDEKASEIARRLAEHQRRMLNLAIQLQALYEGRREDIGGLLKEVEGGDGRGGEGQGRGSGGGGGGSGGGKGSGGGVVVDLE
ncbi:uncharacterized protein C8A04DRAFT_27428 [Dichotomopilus funicola]|uniref:Uncharacterized protein n=1 Tax=Dichotomopilus funicola TaxID=1934379 RepID=A0AAN6V523_9PEZI|nr:hypothetical protein C8A04DRAFT_27428 [Dichotomopilus funicola]